MSWETGFYRKKKKIKKKDREAFSSTYICHTKVSDKKAFANNVDSDQTAPEGEVWSESTLFAIPQKYFITKLHKKSKIKAKKYEIK